MDPVTGAERGIPVRAVLQVDPDAELVTVDLRDNDDNIEGGPEPYGGYNACRRLHRRPEQHWR